MATFYLKKSSNQFYWFLTANNGEIICVSEMYTTKSAALNGIESCKKHSQDYGYFTVFLGKDSKYYWNLKASNGEIICQSEAYVDKQGALKGVESCKINAPRAEVSDSTASAFA